MGFSLFHFWFFFFHGWLLFFKRADPIYFHRPNWAFCFSFLAGFFPFSRIYTKFMFVPKHLYNTCVCIYIYIHVYVYTYKIYMYAHTFKFYTYKYIVIYV